MRTKAFSVAFTQTFQAAKYLRLQSGLSVLIKFLGQQALSAIKNGVVTTTHEKASGVYAFLLSEVAPTTQTVIKARAAY